MSGHASSIPAGQIPGYEIQGKLGAGGMGVVYKALDLKLNRTVALKFLSTDEVTPENRDKLLREARAASALDHANIAAVHTIEETADGRTFIVMGYYDGETLADKVRRGPLQPAHAVNFALQIAQGLQHAHARNITHRDIKPSNVLITNDGTAKILDFGLARVHGPTASTETATLSGTLLYMPPEQAQGRNLDARSDIWSLGVVLFQMLTGRLPFYSDSAASTIIAILNSPPAEMAGVSDELQVVILRTLAKTPDARYQNCGELIRDLEKVAVDDRVPTVTFDRDDLKKQLKAATQSAVIKPPGGVSRRALLLAVFLCVAAGIALSLLVGPLRSRLFGPQEKHIAVLPFGTDSKDPAVQSMADGLMERITGKLSNLDAGTRSLWIVPSGEVRRLKIDDAKSARRELGATVAVSGRVVQTGQAIQLTVDVIDANSMRLLGSASLEQSLSTLASVDSDAVQRIASILRLGVRSEESSDGTTLASGYQSYLEGRGYLQRFDKPGNLDTAVRLFESVVAADPNFALGFASLGEAYWYKYRYDQDSETLRKATEFCNRAIQLNNRLPAVYTTLARIHDNSGNHDLALEEFEQALKLDPRNADAHLGRATVYEAMGRPDDAEKEIQTSIALRPDYWVGITELGSFYFRQRRPEDALRAYRRALELVPDSASAHSNYGVALKNNGRPAEAEIQFKKSLQISESYFAYANYGMLLYRQKNWKDAAQMTEKALQINANDYRVWANLGISYEQMGNTAKAAAAYREELVHLEEIANLRSGDPAIERELGVLYSKDKKREEALRHLNAALARTPTDPRALSEAAEVYENLGDRDRALATVKKALAHGWTLDNLKENPGLRNVLADPRFRKQ